jgi:DNA-binding MarR family transcriptional regulator
MSTRSDSDRLTDCIRWLVRRFGVAERADVACCGMTVAQAATLEALHDVDPIRLGDLGRRLGISASTLTRNLARLRERGLVTTSPDPTDGRAAVVSLTEKGRSAGAQVKSQEHAFARSVLDELPEGGADDTLAALESLLVAVRAATERCCPGAFDHLMTTTEGNLVNHGRKSC